MNPVYGYVIFIEKLMMKYHSLSLIFFLPVFLFGQHTFSIVAIDTATLEIGSAGATCLDTDREGLGAVVISDIIPGRGAVHTQALLNFSNQSRARQRMLAGDRPAELVDYMRRNDVQRNPEVRQYGVVAIDEDGKVEAAAFTGVRCLDVKHHIVGPNYAIQGNILIGTEVLDSMEKAFLRTKGELADRLMAAMNAAAFAGADVRCLSEGVSSRSAFLRLAKPGDTAGGLSIDLVINATPFGVEPIEELYVKYLQFQATGIQDADLLPVEVFPNPFSEKITVRTPYPSEWTLTLSDTAGRMLYRSVWAGTEKQLDDLDIKAATIVLLQVKDNKRPDKVFSQKLIQRGQ